MSKVQTDIRTTSYDAATANSVGYQGTLDDALAQVRAEREVYPSALARPELLRFLGANKPLRALSGLQLAPRASDVTLDELARLAALPEDDSVVYGAPRMAQEASLFSLESAVQRWPENFTQEGEV